MAQLVSVARRVSTTQPVAATQLDLTAQVGPTARPRWTSSSTMAHNRARSAVTAPLTARAAQQAIQLLDRSGKELLESVHSRSVSEQYVHAHVAAIRAAAAVLAVRGRPKVRRAPLSVWELLKLTAPELGEWADFFASGAATRSALEAGRTESVTRRQADDLLRDAERFLSLVRASLDPDLGGLAVGHLADLSA